MVADTLILKHFDRTQKAEKLVVSTRLADAKGKTRSQRLVKTGVSISESAAGLWRALQEALWHDAEQMDIQTVGELLRDIFGRSAQITEDVMSYLSRSQPDHNSADMERLRAASVEVRKLASEFEARWPWVDALRFEAPARSSANRPGRPVKEVFNELRRRLR